MKLGDAHPTLSSCSNSRGMYSSPTRLGFSWCLRRCRITLSPGIFSKTTFRILGRPNTLPLLCSSHTLRLVDEHSSASTLPPPSCARPISARRDEVPRAPIADTIAVMTPRGAIANEIVGQSKVFAKILFRRLPSKKGEEWCDICSEILEKAIPYVESHDLLGREKFEVRSIAMMEEN